MSLRHHEDLLSLEELARSLAALEEGSDAVVDAAARASILRAQLSRALNEQRGEVLELASTAALARRPSDAEVGERLDGFGGGLDSATAQVGTTRTHTQHTLTHTPHTRPNHPISLAATWRFAAR